MIFRWIPPTAFDQLVLCVFLRGLEKTLSWQSENAEAFQRQHHAQGSKQEHHHDVEDGTLGLRNPTPALVGPVLPPKPALDHHREHQVGKASQPGCQGIVFNGHAVLTPREGFTLILEEAL